MKHKAKHKTPPLNSSNLSLQRDDEEKERKAEEKELRTNKALMYVSIFLTLVSLVAFFWLVGVLDWRGTEGRLELDIQYDDCNGGVPFDGFRGQGDRHLMDFNLKDETVTVGNHHQLGHLLTDRACQNVAVQSSPAPLEVTDEFGHIVAVTPTFGGGNWSSVGGMKFPVQKVLDRDHGEIDFVLRYKRKSVLEFTGLSERSFSMINDCPKCELWIETPEEFPIVESSIPRSEITRGAGTPDESTLWDFQLPNKTVPPIHLKMRNERLSRIDHIIDSGIAALLGVAVGGVVNAYLALILLRRSHRYAQVIRAAAQPNTTQKASEEKR